MATKPALAAGSSGLAAPQGSPPAFTFRHAVRARLLAGLVVVLPLLVTVTIVYWLYTMLAQYVIEPLAKFVMWKILLGKPDAELPAWFEYYVAPLLAVALGLLVLYALGFFAQTRLRHALDAVVLRVPLVSVVYKGVQQILNTLGEQGNRPKLQRVVLIEFPHPGTKVPAFVTGQCRDARTQQTILCVYVPTTPVPTSGYMLLVPEEDVVELGWTTEEALQAIISGGLTAPPEVRFSRPAAAPLALGEVRTDLTNDPPPA